MGKYSYYLVAVVIAVILWLLEPRRPKPSGPPPSPTPVSTAPSATPASTPRPPTKALSPSPSTPPTKSIVETLPRAKDLRAEVKADPHAPPPGAISFALNLAKRAREVADSEDKSALFMDELDACAVNRDPQTMNPATQALCLQIARDLAKKYPVLTTKVEDMFKRAEPSAAVLANRGHQN